MRCDAMRCDALRRSAPRPPLPAEPLSFHCGRHRHISIPPRRCAPLGSGPFPARPGTGLQRVQAGGPASGCPPAGSAVRGARPLPRLASPLPRLSAGLRKRRGPQPQRSPGPQPQLRPPPGGGAPASGPGLPRRSAAHPGGHLVTCRRLPASSPQARRREAAAERPVCSRAEPKSRSLGSALGSGQEAVGYHRTTELERS